MARHRVFFKYVFSIEFALSDLFTTFFDLTGQNIYKIEFFFQFIGRFAQSLKQSEQLAAIYSTRYTNHLVGSYMDSSEIFIRLYRRSRPSSSRSLARTSRTKVQALGESQEWTRSARWIHPHLHKIYFTLPNWRTKMYASTAGDKVCPASWARPSRVWEASETLADEYSRACLTPVSQIRIGYSI